MEKANMVTGKIEELTTKLGMVVRDLAESAVKKKGIFTIALSGGSSMEILAKALLARDIRESMDWSTWHVFWVDERRVPVDSPQSNYGRARAIFLDHVDIPEDQIFPIDGTLDAKEAACDYEGKISAMVSGMGGGGFPIFDLLVLGVGEDGHVASLFPGHPALKVRNRMVTSIDDSVKPPRERITLTLSAINRAGNVAFLVTGLSKAPIIKELFTGQGSGIPASMVEPQDGQVVWFVDDDGCNRL